MKYTSAFVRSRKSTVRGGNGRAKTVERWYGVIKWRDDDGWHSMEHALDAANKTEAKAALITWRAKEEAAAAKDEESPKADSDLSEWVKSYIDGLEKSQAVEASTINGYRISWTHVRDDLADETVAGITAARCREWETSMLSDGNLSASTVRKAHRLLKAAMGQAVSDGIRPDNPLSDIRQPKLPFVRPNALDAESRRRLVEGLEGSPETATSMAVMLALYTGMREGEICGLMWRDVDLESRVLWVRRSIGRGEHETYVKATKTNRDRDIPLGDTLTRHLAAWKATYKKRCADDKVLFEPAKLYVIGRTDGSFENPTVLGREWRASSKLLGLTGTEGRRVTFHDLRHSFATAAISAGIDVKTVSSILGHANAAMTLNIYASADPTAKAAAAGPIDEAIMTRR